MSPSLAPGDLLNRVERDVQRALQRSRNGLRSPFTTAEPISGLVVLSVLSMFAGDMFLPAALMISSFLRSTIDR